MIANYAALVKLDDRSALIDVLTGLKSARQIAYKNAKAFPHLGLEEIRDATEAQYQGFCTAIGVRPEPVFDAEEHAARRRAEGHPDYQ